jgi:hypothetical protein
MAGIAAVVVIIVTDNAATAGAVRAVHLSIL